MWLFMLRAMGCNAALTEALSNGRQMPLVGFGTAGGVGSQAVAWAYAEGVRLFDTAQATEWYDERGVAEGLRGQPRESYWLESKLHPRDLGYQSTLAAFPRSLKALNTSYLDVFLLHFPRCYPTLCDGSSGTFQDSWQALEQLYKDGSVRAIGVSNFEARDLLDLLAKATIVPHVVQNYFDPFHQDQTVRALCEEYGIVYQGYSTLGTQWVQRTGENPVLSNSVIKDLAQKYDRSPAQIVLAWAVSRGVGVIPRSVTLENIRQNADIGFQMDEQDLEKIDGLDGENDADEKPLDVTFVNAFDESVEVFWRSPSTLEPVTSLSPGETFASQSFEGHNFLVRSGGQPRYAFDVSASYPFYHLEATSVRRHHEL